MEVDGGSCLSYHKPYLAKLPHVDLIDSCLQHISWHAVHRTTLFGSSIADHESKVMGASPTSIGY